MGGRLHLLQENPGVAVPRMHASSQDTPPRALRAGGSPSELPPPREWPALAAGLGKPVLPGADSRGTVALSCAT